MLCGRSGICEKTAGPVARQKVQSISVVADLVDLVPQGCKILEGERFVVRVAQQRGGMKGRHEQRALFVKEFTVILGDRKILVDHLLGSHTAQTNHDFRAQQLELLA